MNDRDYKLFSIGLCAGTLISTTIFIQSIKLSNQTDWISNKIISIQRSKFISGENNFYFDTEIDSNIFTKFKKFMDELEPDSTVNLYFETNGGYFSIAQIICNIILNHKGTTNSIILNKSFSAGTLCALCCKNIYMHKNAHLSPVDVIQSNFFSSTQLSSIKNVVNNKTADKIDDSTFILDDQSRKCKTVLNKIFEKICIIHNFNEKTKKIVFEEIFEGEKYTHNKVFSYDDLCLYGMDIQPITKEQEKKARLIINYI